MPRLQTAPRALPPRIRAIIERRKELGLTRRSSARMAGFSFSPAPRSSAGPPTPVPLRPHLTNLAWVLLASPSSWTKGSRKASRSAAPCPSPLPFPCKPPSPGKRPPGLPGSRGTCPRGPWWTSSPSGASGPWLFSLTLPLPLTKPLRLLAELEAPVPREGAPWAARGPPRPLHPRGPGKEKLRPLPPPPRASHPLDRGPGTGDPRPGAGLRVQG